MKELPPDIHEKVQALCASGDALQESAEFVDAVVKYEQAFALLPEPKAEWDAATWIMAALLDAHFFRGEWAACREAAEYAFKFCGAVENPFFHLRAGQVYYELGEAEKAKQRERKE